MNSKRKLYKIFKTEKPIIGMIHLKGTNKVDILDRAIDEIDVMTNNGIDAVLVENYFPKDYFSGIESVKMVLQYLCQYKRDVTYGLNVLGDYELAFKLAITYGAKFIQIDSVAGHLDTFHDMIFHNKINNLRAHYNTFVLGGVRFKYQPVLSQYGLERDLQNGMQRCDAIVVTGDGTGKETDLDKIKEFREVIKNFPLIVGAGLTAENCYQQLSLADGAIVGSYLKDNYKDYGDVSEEHVKELMGIVKTLR